MRARCYNPNDINYKNYGAKGITVCDQWRDNYDAFFADMGECPEGLTIERIDGKGNYDPFNCKWADYTEQLNNRPGFNRWIEHDGRKQTLAQWAKEIGISLETLMYRLKRGTIAQAIEKGTVKNWAPGQHGTIGTYVSRKCRCDLCCQTMREYKKAAYWRKKELQNVGR